MLYMRGKLHHDSTYPIANDATSPKPKNFLQCLLTHNLFVIFIHKLLYMNANELVIQKF